MEFGFQLAHTGFGLKAGLIHRFEGRDVAPGLGVVPGEATSLPAQVEVERGGDSLCSPVKNFPHASENGAAG